MQHQISAENCIAVFAVEKPSTDQYAINIHQSWDLKPNVTNQFKIWIQNLEGNTLLQIRPYYIVKAVTEGYINLRDGWTLEILPAKQTHQSIWCALKDCKHSRVMYLICECFSFSKREHEK